MSTIDPDELAELMTEMADDQVVVIAFVAAFGDTLARVVRHHLCALCRRDLAADRDEVQGLVWEVALFIQERAGAWQPGGALPWNWARRGIAKLVADAIGHARADVDIEVVEVMPTPATTGLTIEVGLDDLYSDPTVVLLRRALAEIACSDRDRDVHVEYRVQVANGDPSPAHTVADLFDLKPDNVRQIDHRLRHKLAGPGRDRSDLRRAGRPGVGHRGAPIPPRRPVHPSGGMRPLERRSEWSWDLTKLRERLAERLRAQGAPHPDAGAAALAARGATGAHRCDFAEALGLDEEALLSIERGEVAVEDWPAALRREVERT